MKKIILLLLFLLPVGIVAITFAVAGAIGREVMFVEITDVVFDEQYEDNRLFAEFGSGNWQVTAQIGDVIDFERHLRLYPSNARYSYLEQALFVSNTNAVSVVNGQIRILQNMTTVDFLNQGVEIRVQFAGNPFFTIFVDIERDNTRIDYFGFCYELFTVGRAWSGVYRPLGLTSNVAEQRLELAVTPATLQLREALQYGMNVAPAHLTNPGLEATHPGLYTQFLNSLAFSSSDDTVLLVTDNGGGDVQAFVAGTAGDVVEITITSTWGLDTFTTTVRILLV